ncbi:unnamed protein product, partial [marine sediment metagenome]
VVEGKWGHLLLNGKHYEFGHKDGAPILKEINLKEIKKRERTAERIAKELKNKVDAEKILMETLMTNLSKKELFKLEKIVFNKKRKHTVKTRAHHCVDLKVGNFILPLG